MHAKPYRLNKNGLCCCVSHAIDILQRELNTLLVGDFHTTHTCTLDAQRDLPPDGLHTCGLHGRQCTFIMMLQQFPKKPLSKQACCKTHLSSLSTDVHCVPWRRRPESLITSQSLRKHVFSQQLFKARLPAISVSAAYRAGSACTA